jgi:hypothetical protein
MQCNPVLAARLFAPEFCQTARKGPPRANKEHDPEKCLRFSDQIMLPKKGGGAPKGAGVDTAGPPTSVAARLAIIAARAPFGNALAFRRSTAALAKPRQNLSALAQSAQSGPALHGRGQPIRAPGSQLLADLRRGRPGEFPNRLGKGLRTPSRAPLPLHQSAVTG